MNQINLLEELYYGNINPTSNCFDKNSGYGKFSKIISDNQEKLTSFLEDIPEAEKERHLFSQLINAQNEVLIFREQERFIEGFGFGAKFMLDTFLVPRETVIKDIC